METSCSGGSEASRATTPVGADAALIIVQVRPSAKISKQQAVATPDINLQLGLTTRLIGNRDGPVRGDSTYWGRLPGDFSS